MVKNKKAQLTLFIILGIVLLFFIGLIFYAVPHLRPILINSEDFKTYMDVCLKQNAEFTLYQFGFSGVSNKYYSKQFAQVPYALHQSKTLVLTNEQAEKALAQSFKSGIAHCVDEFPNKKYEITEGEHDVKVLIGENVIFDVKPDIKVFSGTSSTKYNRFRIKIPAKLDAALEASRAIAELYKSNQLELYTYMDNQEFQIRVLSYKDNNLVLYLIDKENLISGQPFIFRFAMLR